MAFYNYKKVVYRDGYQEVKERWLAKVKEDCFNDDIEYDGDPGYAGDCWDVTSFWIDEMQAELKELRNKE